MYLSFGTIMVSCIIQVCYEFLLDGWNSFIWLLFYLSGSKSILVILILFDLDRSQALIGISWLRIQLTHCYSKCLLLMHIIVDYWVFLGYVCYIFLWCDIGLILVKYSNKLPVPVL